MAQGGVEVRAEQARPDGGETETSASAAEAESLTVAELSEMCQQLADDDADTRRAAAEMIVASGPSSEATVRHRLRRELRSAPGDLDALLDRLSPDVHGRRLPTRSDGPPFDLLPALIAEPREGDSERTVVEATEVVTLLRALLEVESTSATRAIIHYGVRERGVFKAEVARDVERLGEKALPALILTTQHPNESVAQLAEELLVWLRRATRGRQVQVRDPGTLAEILTAFGELSDRDTIPVLLSFSGSEQAVVREAARASLLRFGPAILWPARSRYENFTGEEPQRRWGWEELARRLFEAQDAARTAQAERAMAEGLRLFEAGDHEAMLAAFQSILARWPDYSRRGEMVPGLVAFADELERQGHRARARSLLTQALLVAPDGPQANAIEARLNLEAIEAGLERGVADEVPLDTLVEQGVSPERVSQLRERIARRTDRPPPRFYRVIAAAGLAVLGIGFLGLLIFRKLATKHGTSATENVAAQPENRDPSTGDEDDEGSELDEAETLEKSEDEGTDEGTEPAEVELDEEPGDGAGGSERAEVELDEEPGDGAGGSEAAEDEPDEEERKDGND